MRFLFRWVFRLFLLLAVLVVSLILLKDTLLKSFAEYRIRSETGLDVKIGKLETGLFSPTVTLENFRLYNRADYGGSAFLDMPELHLECYRAPLALRKFKFKLVRVHIDHINIVENKSGETNLVGVMSGIEKLRTGEQSPLRGFEFAGIDLLNVTFGKVNYSSLRRPDKSKELDLDIRNEIVTDVKSVSELKDLLLNLTLKKGVTISSPPKRSHALPPGKGG